MIFNDIKKNYLKVSREKKRPAWAPIDREFVNVPGFPGAYLSNSQHQMRVIQVPVYVKSDGFSDLQKVKEDLAEWLIHDEAKELIFRDENDRIYLAVVSGGLDLDELFRVGKGTITFICHDPYKYGPEKTLPFPADIVTVDNKGTAEADPIFELTATKKTTFAMISNGEEYNLIGTLAADDVEIIDARVPILKENGETLNTWESIGAVVDTKFNDLSGTMIYDDIGIIAQSYGTGDKTHGPAMFKEINPIQDFEIETLFDIISNRVEDNYRMEIYMFDENMTMLGKMGINDNNRFLQRRVGLGRVGPYSGQGVRYAINGDNYMHDDMGETSPMYLRVKREGNRFTFYISELRNGKHTSRITETYIDTSNTYAGKLKYVQIFLGSWQNRTRPWRNRVLYLNVYELQKETVDQTPYILDVGDVVTFDHKDDDILVNGEPRNDLKNFGGSFFKLGKGENMLVVTPEDSFKTKVTLRDKYL